MKLPISLVVITLNEERNIERCLASAPWVSEIVVLDSGSVDQTCEIATRLGAKVVHEPFRGYRDQKIRAMELATQEWILSLDADEFLSPVLQRLTEDLFRSGVPLVDGFEMSRMSFHLGRWIRYGGWYPDRQIRLFRKSQAKWVGGHVHERVEVEKPSRLLAPIFHHVFEDLEDQVETNNRYSTLGALDLKNRGSKSSLLKIVFKPVSKFLETYVLKLGFLDARAGFIISVSAAYSVFLKYVKLWELENKKTFDEERWRLPSEWT